MNARRFSAILLVAPVLWCTRLVGGAPTDSYTLGWTQSGFFNQRDNANGLVVDSHDHVYVVGESGPIYGSNSTGGSPGLVAKYNPSGTLEWLTTAYASMQSADQPSGIAIDSSNNVYIAGVTYRYPGGTNAFVVKYDQSGSRLWEAHAGLPNPNNVFGADVAVDSFGNAYLSGSTTGNIVPGSNGHGYNGFVAKYDSNGNQVWTTQFPDAVGDFADTISIDPVGKIFVSGNLGAADTYVAKLDTNGDVLWRVTPNFSTIPGRHTEISESVTDTAGNLYVAGATNSLYDSARGYQEFDAVVAKFDPAGTLVWQRPFSLRTLDIYNSITLDAAGNVYVSGQTFDSPFGFTGATNSIWAKYDSSGNLLWSQEFGTNEIDGADGIGVDSQGRVYVAGNIQRDVNGYYAADLDAYVARFDPVPEPTAAALALTVVVSVVVCCRRRRQRTGATTSASRPSLFPRL